MNEDIKEDIKKIIEFLQSEKGKSIVKDVIFYSDSLRKIINNILGTYKNFDGRREKAFEEGFTRNQNFEKEKEQFQEQKDTFEKNFDFNDFIKGQMDNIKDGISSRFEGYSWFENVVGLKEYLTDEVDEEAFEELVGRLSVSIASIPNFDPLKGLIGDEKYEELISIVVTHSLRVTKVMYDRASEKIDVFEFKERFKNLYENYVLTVLKFVNENDNVMKYASTVMNFAFGNKVAAIQSVVLTAAVDLLDEDKRESIKKKLMDTVDTVKSWFKKKSNKFKNRKRRQRVYEDHQA